MFLLIGGAFIARIGDRGTRPTGGKVDETGGSEWMVSDK